MTNSRIKNIHNKAAASKKLGYFNEALLINYHLNVDLILYILNKTVPDYSVENKKIKTIAKDFLSEIAVNSKLKAVINRKNFKAVKLWLKNMDGYFKIIKLKPHANTKQLLTECEGIFILLNISINKLGTSRAA